MPKPSIPTLTTPKKIVSLKETKEPNMNLHRIFISPARWILERIPAGRNFCAAYRSAREKRRKSAAIARLHRYGSDIIEEVSKALSGSGAFYFADYGTLLGATREGNFIPHDDDIDYGVLRPSISPAELTRRMISSGFKFYRAFSYEGKVTEVSFLKHKVPVDFFFVFRDSEGTLFSQVYNKFEPDGSGGFEALVGKRAPLPEITSIKNIRICGAMVPVPVNNEELLVYIYGKEWRIPVVNWTPDSSAGVNNREPLKSRAKILLNPSAITEDTRN